MPKTPTAGQLWTVLARCHKALSTHVERSVAAAGLGLTDFMILEALLHKGSLTITEIQGKILLASGSMTAAVDRLEKKGAIVRRSIKEDRRARRLELTPEGRQVIERVFGEHETEFDSVFSVLNGSEMQSMYRTLKKLGLHAAASNSIAEQA